MRLWKFCKIEDIFLADKERHEACYKKNKEMDPFTRQEQVYWEMNVYS